VALPAPRPGLVISYAYLWSDEDQRGALEGRKDRPCVVVLNVEDRQGGQWVTVVPVTHAKPTQPDWAIQIPAATKARLGLDEAPSWVMATETNWFLWPSPDLRPIGRGRPARYAFGYLPARMIMTLRQKLAARRNLRMVRRT
jgi:hypothetical protein